MKKQPNKRLRFHLIVTLLLVMIVTGLGKPGFLLGFLRPKQAKINAAALVAPDRVPAVGHSDPFAAEPIPGFTIAAERNAMDHNREFKVTEMAWDVLSNLQDRFMDNDTGIMLLAGWEVDAGLGDDDRMPGTYTVGIDLKRLGIPEHLYHLLSAYRVDEAGHFYEYLTWIKNDSLFYASCQNSGVVLGVDEVVAVTGKEIIIEPAAPETGFFNGDGVYWVCDPADSSRRQYKIEYEQSNVSNQIYAQCNTIIADRSERARKEAEQQLPNATANERCDRVYKIKQRMYKEDPVYRQAIDAHKMTKQEEAEKSRQLVAKLGTMVYEAHKYLMSLNIRLPDQATTLYLLPKMNAYAETEPVGWFSGPYVNVGLDVLEQGSKQELDEMQLTLTHELFHVCQLRYNGIFHANVKFYEAMAQLLEEDAYRYFRSHPNVKGTENIITTEKNLENGKAYQYYVMPFDEKKATYYDDMGRAEKWSMNNTELCFSGYPIARFFDYLNETVSKKSFKEMMENYESVVTYMDLGGMDFTQHIKATWDLSDNMLTDAYLAFAKKYQTKFYECAKAKMNMTPARRLAFPASFIEKDKKTYFKLVDHAYSIRINSLMSSLDNIGRVGILVATDKDFYAQLTDMTLLPVGSGQWTKCKHGFYFYPHSGTSDIMEIDGGTNENPSAVSGYTVYQLEPPKLEKPKVEDGLLVFKLPEMSQAAKDDKIDGYRVTITCSDGKKTVYHPQIVIAGKTVKIKTSRLSHRYIAGFENLGYNVTVCEYIKDKDEKRYIYGPESDGSMDSLLEEMGAAEGEITASIYWPSKDDLDLHCITPNQSEIFYGCKFADGGELDVDMQVQAERDSGVENIYFATPVPGVYQFYVHNYTDRTDGDVGCRVRIKVGNQVLVDETVPMGGRSKIWKLEYRGFGKEQNVEILEDLP
ncbi:hypothetical protein C3V36_03565 [Lachnospiraceae bacterium oral taxon 500]|nr:hypothetical protein C3V36_03565 [Lachnospiraceae bacterium oral taxon 500]